MENYIPQPFFDTLDSLKDREFRLSQEKKLAERDKQLKLDFHYAWEFLHSYRGSEATFNAYRREIERLLHWTWFVSKKMLTLLRRNDIETFIEFCQRPPKHWIGLKHVPRFISHQGLKIPNPDWRPFVAHLSKRATSLGETPNAQGYTVSQTTVQSIFSILSSFYNYLIQEEYTDINPVALVRQKSKFVRKKQVHTIRRLSELQWTYVIDAAEHLARQHPDEHERTLFIMNALYGMYLRISELAASPRWMPQMGHFHIDQYGNWWFTTVGKGNKERIISVSDAMLNALKRYRMSLQLSPLPAPGETTPLIFALNRNGPITSTRNIRNIVQTCFDKAIERLKEDHMQDEADQLMSATVHWLRHTGISDDVKRRPREHVRDDAGHGSGAITDRYIDIELRERHASAKLKKIKPE